MGFDARAKAFALTVDVVNSNLRAMAALFLRWFSVWVIIHQIPRIGLAVRLVNMRNPIAVICLSLCLASPSDAGTLIESMFSGQPVMFIDKGVPTGCGIRFVGLAKPTGSSTRFDGIDVSLITSRDGGGMIKGGGFVDARMVGDQSKRREYRPTALWLRAAGSNAVLPNGAGFLSNVESPNAVLFASEQLKDVLDVLNAAINSAPIQIGIHRPGEKAERIYYGIVEMSEADKVQLIECLGAWANRLRGRLGQSDPQK